MAALQELSLNALNIPAESAFSLDIGSTCCKLVYIKPRHESEEEQNENSSTRLEFAKSPIEQDAEIRTILRREFPSSDIGAKLFCTGLYSTAHIISEIEKEFQTKATILSEFECMHRGFDFLVHNVPETDAFHPLSSRGLQAAKEMDGQWKNTQLDLHGFKEMEPERKVTDTTQGLGKLPFAARVGDFYPCIIANGGSAFSVNLVESKDSLKMVDMSTRSGGTLSGLGQLLLGQKDYSKITELASKGDESKVTTYFNELRKSTLQGESGTNAYFSIPDTLMCFSFMRACQDDTEFNKSDLARALVYMLAEDMAQLSFWISRLYNCKYMFVAGGITSHDVVREAFTRQFYQRVLANKSECELYFLKHGQYMGALGALLSTK